MMYKKKKKKIRRNIDDHSAVPIVGTYQIMYTYFVIEK